MEKISEILQAYAIFPQAIVRVTDRVFKIKANGKQFALKRSRLTKTSVKTWQSAYHQAARQNLYEVIPIFLTQDKQLYVENEGDIYYLTPWIENQTRNINEDKIRSIYQQVGRIHVQTKSMYQLNRKEMDHSFQSYKKSCMENEHRIQVWVERMEQTHYPSPFELQVLTNYRDLRLSLYRSRQLVDEIVALSDSETNWGICLNHGSLQLDHLFNHYIINWERASYKHAIYDLNDLFNYTAVEQPDWRDTLIQSFSTYMEENPLNRLEQALLSLYLLNTKEYVKLVENHFRSGPVKDSEVKRSIKLEHLNRRVVFGLSFDSYLEQEQSRGNATN